MRQDGALGLPIGNKHGAHPGLAAGTRRVTLATSPAGWTHQGSPAPDQVSSVQKKAEKPLAGVAQ